MLKLEMESDALKFILDLQAKQFRQIVVKIFGLMRDPTPPDSKQLSGYPYLRVDSGEFRIIYRHDAEMLRIVLVGKRNDDEVYRDMKRKGLPSA